MEATPADISLRSHSQHSNRDRTYSPPSASLTTLRHGHNLSPQEWARVDARLQGCPPGLLASRSEVYRLEALRARRFSRESQEARFNRVLAISRRAEFLQLKQYGVEFVQLTSAIPQELHNREMAVLDEYWSRRNVRAEDTHGCITVEYIRPCASCSVKNLYNKMRARRWKASVDARIVADRRRLAERQQHFKFTLGCELHPIFSLAKRFIPMDLWADAAVSLLNGHQPENWESLRRPVDTTEPLPLYEGYRLPSFDEGPPPPYSET